MAEGKSVNPWLIAVSVMIATFMEVIDTSIASVAVPYIAGSVSATNDEATWVLTFYLLSNAVILPASAWFSLRFGRKRFLMTCIIIFTISSFACGAATSLGMILIARLVQGAGGGALQPISQAILTESFPPEKRGLATAIFALGVVVAPVLGPTLGGWLTDTYSWRWAFYVNIPIGALALFMIGRFIEDPPYIKNAKPGRFDGIGLGLLAVWLGCMQIILDRGQEDDWFGATWIRYTFLVMVAAFLVFIWWQFTNKKPLVDLTIFKNRNFAIGCFLIFMFGAAIYGIVTLLPLYYQTLMGYSATSAGLAVSPRGVGAIVAMPFIGILTSRVDNRWMITAGFIIFGVCSLFPGPNLFRYRPLVHAMAGDYQWLCFGHGVRAALHDGLGRSSAGKNWQRQWSLQSDAERRRKRRHLLREYHRGPTRTTAPDGIGAQSCPSVESFPDGSEPADASDVAHVGPGTATRTSVWHDLRNVRSPSSTLGLHR